VRRVRDLAGLMDAMRLLAANGVQTISPAEVQNFPPKGGDLQHAFFLLLGKPTQDQEQSFREAAGKYKTKFWFGTVPNPSEQSPEPLGSLFSSSGGSAQLVAVYRNDKQKALFDMFEPAVIGAPSQTEDVVTFVEAFVHPPVIEMAPGSYRGLAASSKKGVPTVLALAAGDDGQGNPAIVKPLMEAGAAASQKFRFAYVDTSKKILSDWVQNTFDMREGVQLPTVVVLYISSREYVPFPSWKTESIGPESGSAIASFLNQVSREELERLTTGDANTLDMLKAKLAGGISAIQRKLGTLIARFSGRGSAAEGEF